MLTFGIYFLTAVLVLDCIFIVLLVLVQLPKKEAGMGQAFGGAATDARTQAAACSSS
jgi:protein translocase SecG subunit